MVQIHAGPVYAALLKFTCAPGLLCFEGLVFLVFSICSGFYIHSLPLPQGSLREGFDEDIPFRAK